jgi:A/G-specific adenine glycosylase
MAGPIAEALLAHYDANARQLPWRGSCDPYRIWISEIMLQQTRVETVRERYGRFLARFPGVTALAAASTQEVCEEWAGLGYYARARNLHCAARMIVDRHGGRFPSSVEDLRALPGVGLYTVGAIRSIAFGAREAAVDANVERVLCRLYAIDAAAGRARDARVHALAAQLADCSRAGDLNQALMDLGSDICTPRSPDCGRCPLARFCGAHAAGLESTLPAKAPRARRRLLRMAFAWVESDAGALLLEQRALDGLWAGQWQLPAEEGPRARFRLQARLGCALASRGVTVEHLLTHREVRATVYAARDLPIEHSSGGRWCVDPDSAPLSALARKAFAAFRLSLRR